MKQLISDMEALNSVAPYQVEHLGYNIYSFQSKLGARYWLKLLTGIYLGENDCHHLVFVMDKNGQNLLSFLDGNVGKTVMAILSRFFIENPKDCLLFSSEASKGRSSVKSRFYHHWFEWYMHNDGKVDVDFIHRTVKHRDEEIPFNLMLRNDHPEADLIRTTFNEQTQAIADVMYEK